MEQRIAHIVFGLIIALALGLFIVLPSGSDKVEIPLANPPQASAR